VAELSSRHKSPDQIGLLEIHPTADHPSLANLISAGIPVERVVMGLIPDCPGKDYPGSLVATQVDTKSDTMTRVEPFHATTASLRRVNLGTTPIDDVANDDADGCIQHIACNMAPAPAHLNEGLAIATVNARTLPWALQRMTFLFISAQRPASATGHLPILQPAKLTRCYLHLLRA
jgi:hypothetical protein